jgi:hypothetical protein
MEQVDVAVLPAEPDASREETQLSARRCADVRQLRLAIRVWKLGQSHLACAREVDVPAVEPTLERGLRSPE